MTTKVSKKTVTLQ